jgi:anti-sigma B factor antagonist
MATQDRFTIAVTYDDDKGATVLLRGELDVGSVPETRETLLSLLADGFVNVTLDLEGLTFIDSTGIGVFVGGWRRAEARGGRFRLVNPTPRVRDAIQLVGLGHLFETP